MMFAKDYVFKKSELVTFVLYHLAPSICVKHNPLVIGHDNLHTTVQLTLNNMTKMSLVRVV